MAFSYFRRLSPLQKKIYRRSNEITNVPITRPETFRPRLHTLLEMLSLGDRWRTEESAQAFVTDLTRSLNLPPAKVSVLERRPSKDWGELHGLYERNPHWTYPKITVWMRTAQKSDIVAPKTFFRTLAHEIGHHLDYVWLKLPVSFHTEGFYKRESSLVRQLYAEGSEKAVEITVRRVV